MLLKHLFILCPQAPELPVHDINSLWKFSPPFLLFLLLLSLPYCSTPQKSVFNLITIPQWRLQSWMPEKLQSDMLLFLSLLNNSFLMRSGQNRSDIPSTKLTLQLPRRTRTGAQAALQHINLLSRQQQLQEKQEWKMQGSKAVFFHKSRELEILSGCELHGSVHLL